MKKKIILIICLFVCLFAVPFNMDTFASESEHTISFTYKKKEITGELVYVNEYYGNISACYYIYENNKAIGHIGLRKEKDEKHWELSYMNDTDKEVNFVFQKIKLDLLQNDNIYIGTFSGSAGFGKKIKNGKFSFDTNVKWYKGIEDELKVKENNNDNTSDNINTLTVTIGSSTETFYLESVKDEEDLIACYYTVKDGKLDNRVSLYFKPSGRLDIVTHIDGSASPYVDVAYEYDTEKIDGVQTIVGTFSASGDKRNSKLSDGKFSFQNKAQHSKLHGIAKNSTADSKNNTNPTKSNTYVEDDYNSCGYCAGTKLCHICYGDGSNLCSYCFGGRCSNCGGQGTIMKYTANGNVNITCAHCKGTGSCNRCNGTGRTKCNYCNNGVCRYCN